MTLAPTLSAEFPQASLSLQGLLDQLQADLTLLSTSTSEAYRELKTRARTSWQNGPEIIHRYRTALLNLPRELKRRDFIKELGQELDLLERELKASLTRLKGTDFSLKNLQAQVHETAERVRALEEHKLIKKFLKGETILGSRKNIQWSRKLTHTSLGLFFVYFFVYSGWSQLEIWSLAGPFVAFAFTLEMLRHRKPRVNEWVWRVFGGMMRESEKTHINAAVLYILSMVIVYVVFPLEVAMLTLLFIAIGDTVAGLVGIYWGRHKLSAHVSLEGFLACFATCALLAALCAGVLFQNTLPLITLIPFALLSGVVGALAEASFKKLDDNLVMPLLSAPALWGLMHAFLIL